MSMEDNKDIISSEVIELILSSKYFYGHILQQFRRVVIEEDDPARSAIHTLAVNITDDLKPNLFINRNFYTSLTQEEKLAVLEHEILHILNKHPLRLEKRNHYVWNLAADTAINQFIKGLPENALMCSDCDTVIHADNKGNFPKACTHCKKELDPEKEKINLCNLDFNMGDGSKLRLEADKPAEAYYDTLWNKMPKTLVERGSRVTDSQEQDARNKIKGKGEQEGPKGADGDIAHATSSGGEGEGENQQGATAKQFDAPSGGSGTDDKNKKSEKQDQKDPNSGNSGKNEGGTSNKGSEKDEKNNLPKPLDDHSVWETSADNKEMAHEKIKEIVRRADTQAKRERTRGYMPGWLQGLIDACLAHKTKNWKSELRQFVGYEEFHSFESTRKKLNKRFQGMPGYKVKRKAHMVVAVDSSGSVGDDEFAKFFKEIDIMKSAGVSITIVDCDAAIQAVYEYKHRRPAKIRRHGYGGTDFRPVFDFVKNKRTRDGKFTLKKKVDGIIYCTDGCGSYPDSTPCPTIWVMTPDYKDYWGGGWNAKWGKKIIMERDVKAKAI